MWIPFSCSTCGRHLKARDHFAGSRAVCPDCGSTVEIPKATAGQPGSAAQSFVADSRESTHATDIVEFLDPPMRTPSPPPQPEPSTPKEPVLRRMLEALLDPRAIHWLLTLGGGLAVLGLIIWLVSKGLFEDPRIVAVAMGLGSLAVLAAGWFVTLKTKYRVAGQALTFLGCVVLPLNLWFYHAQDLIPLQDHLWIGGVVCVLLFAATVYVLRDGLFMYAVEAGITLTLVLLMADLGLVSDVANLSLWLAGLAIISIHAERAFAPEGEFSRRKYGLPLFWSGQVQLAFALLLLLGAQILGWLNGPLALNLADNLLIESTLLAGGIWVVGMYLYLYSDLVVRRIGVYVYLAAICLLMAQVTLLLPHLEHEGLIAALAITAVVLHFASGAVGEANANVRRHLSIIASVISPLPVLLGIVLHMRATSSLAGNLQLPYATGWLFVGVMLLVAVTNRISAYLVQREHSQISAMHFFLSAASLLVAAAGLLRQLGWTTWSWQAPVLMLIPIAYIIASRLWRSHSPEAPLARVAHASTAVILGGTILSALDQQAGAYFTPVLSDTRNLLLGLTFVEASLFYSLAMIFRRRSWNAYFATAAACGAIWQFLGYFGVPAVWNELLFAVLGLSILFVARALGITEETRYDDEGRAMLVPQGAGLTLFQSGNAILSTALLIAFLKGLSELAVRSAGWLDFGVLLLTIAAAAAAMAVVPVHTWKRWYGTAAAALAGVSLLQLNVLFDLSGWRKLEILTVVIGLATLAASHLGRFREEGTREDDSVTAGLWFGSLLAAIPLFLAVCYFRFVATGPSLRDEIALVTITVLMLVTGCGWRIRATTLLGGAALVVYLVILIGSIVYHPQVAIGVYLFIGGGLIFALGVLLSIYRERILAIPDRIAKKEGLFQVIGWR